MLTKKGMITVMNKLTKTLILSAAITILILSLTACSSKESVPGKYYNTKNKAEYIELKSDNTFVLKEYGDEYTGTYTVKDKTLSLKIAIGKTAPKDTSTGTIDGNTIVDDEKIVWEKE
jgi:hypothetical protein